VQKELKESGVKFRKKKNAATVLDIAFTGGVLESRAEDL